MISILFILSFLTDHDTPPFNKHPPSGVYAPMELHSIVPIVYRTLSSSS